MDKSEIQNLEGISLTEEFLKEFLEYNPIYKEIVIGKGEYAKQEHNELMEKMERLWHRKMHNQEFLFKDTQDHLNENYFIPLSKNVSIIKNLRYMPLLLHSHEFIEVNYVLKSGDSYFIDENNSFKLKDGDIILSPPNFIHTFKTHNDDSVILDIIIRVSTFDTAFFNLLTNNNYLTTMFTNALYGSSTGYILWRCEGDKQLGNMVLDMYKEWNKTDDYKDKMLEILIMQFFVTLMRYHEKEAIFSAPYGDHGDERFRVLLNYIYTHYQYATLSQMAIMCDYSERQIIRLLKKHTGKSFSALLQEARMRKALSLLKNPEAQIHIIASRLGYASVGYFTRVFKQTFTFSPLDFQKRCAERDI